MENKVRMTLQDWLRSTTSNPLSHRDTMLLWKGLSMLIRKADIPSTQAGTAEVLSSLIHCFEKEASIRFYHAFLKVMSEERHSIDKWHKHKWIMLISRVSRQCLIVLHNNEWEDILIKQLTKHVEEIISDRSASRGFLMDFATIFLDELAKATAENVSKSKVNSLILPFTTVMVDRASQPKKIKLSTASEQQYNLVDTCYLPTDEIATTVGNLQQDTFNGISTIDADKENVITVSVWDKADNTIFRKSRKIQVYEANARWFGLDKKQNQPISSTSVSANKKVKIMLEFNRSQEATEYLKQLSSQKISYDKTKRPGKGLLKHNSVILNKNKNIRI